MRTKVKTEKLGALIKKLDTQVSLFVRLNAADQNGTVKCISCDEKMFWSDADTAHLKDRDNMGTRFFLMNLAPACKNCNRFNHYEHIKAWENKMRIAQLSVLDIQSRSMVKFTRFELEEMILDYTEKVKVLRKGKGL